MTRIEKTINKIMNKLMNGKSVYIDLPAEIRVLKARQDISLVDLKAKIVDILTTERVLNISSER